MRNLTSSCFLYLARNLLFSTKWMVGYEIGKKETREGGADPIPFAEYIRRYQTEDLYCVTGLPKLVASSL